MSKYPNNKIILPISVLFLLFTVQVNAQKTKVDNKISETLKLELLRLVFTDLDDDYNAKKSVEIRDLSGESESQIYEGKMKINYANENWFMNNGRQQLLLFINVSSDGSEISFSWSELNLLALYDVGEKPRLLDIVDVSCDRENGFYDVLKIHPKQNVVVIEHRHHNAGENFRAFTFVYTEQDKFKNLFDGFPFLYYGRSCKSEINETGDIKTIRNPRNAYQDIVFNIKVVGIRYAEDCDTLRGKTTKNFSLRATLQCGKYKFTDNGVELKRIRREEKRLGFGE